jgi:hypothetical protein
MQMDIDDFRTRLRNRLTSIGIRIGFEEHLPILVSRQMDFDDPKSWARYREMIAYCDASGYRFVRKKKTRDGCVEFSFNDDAAAVDFGLRFP